MLGMTPNEAYKITDPDKINKINELKNKEYSKINKKRSYLEMNGKVLSKCQSYIIVKVLHSMSIFYIYYQNIT